MMPSQLSSTPLQVSFGGTQLSHAQVELHVRVPVLMQLVVHACTAPMKHAKPLSMTPSQSSSMPLHSSAGGLQVPHAQLPLQVRLPIVPHAVVHAPIRPAQHAKPSSHTPSQLSSVPLHVSAGGWHAFQLQPALHVRVPLVPQLVVQAPLAPAQQAKVSSHCMLQLSSMPLQTSAGAWQLPHVQVEVQVRVPLVPQLVPHELVEPGTHVNVSSIRPSQSSSTPLHTSGGGAHEP